MSGTYKEESRKGWHLPGDAKPGVEHLQLGCMQRIADATELMARRYQELIDERDRWKRWHDTEQQAARRLARSNNSLRGQITKLKKRLDAASAPIMKDDGGLA